MYQVVGAARTKIRVHIKGANSGRKNTAVVTAVAPEMQVAACFVPNVMYLLFVVVYCFRNS